jgi:hypothetical protein
MGVNLTDDLATVEMKNGGHAVGRATQVQSKSSQSSTLDLI